ncbi:hypothetical protein C0992_000983 [Termitomyces sp. T32_za158]|nr:hypothetical protein C0992_000983 [Termitomyces sp. T32_za158]
MSNSKISLFLIGASGFIGGTLLTSLLAREDRHRFDITVLIRGEERATLIKDKLALKTVVADLSDFNVVSAAAENADVVINTANSDHPAGVKAIIEGLTKRRAKTGKTGIYIHSSGTGALTDNAKGEYKSEKVYDDEHVEDIQAIPVDYVHRACDTVISAAGAAGDIRSYIVMPPLICDFEWKQLAHEIGSRLHREGVILTAETRPFTTEEVEDALGSWAAFAYGANSRSKAIKAYKLGWNPTHGDEHDGLFESIVPEYHAVLEEGKDQAPIVHFDEMYALNEK